jgi:hypothetical protein
MAAQALPRRVASPPLSIPAGASRQLPMAPPRLWPNLSVETQTQIARTLAELMRRIQPPRGGQGRRSVVLIAPITADERRVPPL